MSLPDLSSLRIGSTVKPTPTPVDDNDNNKLNLDNLDMSESMMSPPIVQKTAETIAKETEERIIIQLYQSKFPQELAILSTELSSQNLLMLGLDDLKNLHNKCDKLLGSSLGCESRRKLFNACIYMIEKASLYANIHCEGLTTSLVSDDIFWLALKYLSSSECNLETVVFTW